MKITLSNKLVVEVPEGADPAAFRRLQEAKIRLAGQPRKATRRREYQRKSSKRRMDSVIGRAVLGLVERVNKDNNDYE